MIELQDVSKVYENGTKAVRDISLQLPKVGMVAITGKSGCGKSTLLNLLSNNDEITSGILTYNDTSYKDIDSKDLIRDFGYIYQDFKLIENLTVYQNIMIGHELSSDEIDYDLIINTAKDLGIFDMLDEKVYSLSGGQMQRVAIARAIVRQPKVIFADEPTGNLDSDNSINVYNILRKLANEILVVVVSHDMEISTWADRVITLSDGKVIEDNLGKSISFVEIEKKEKSAEEKDIEEILQMQNAIKNKYKKTSEFFSFKNIPKRARKQVALGGKSSLGLSVAFLNKDIVKKVCLTIVMVILIALMTLSCAMTFARVEKTMANAINATSGKKIFAVKPVIEKQNYTLSADDMKKFDKLLTQNDLTYYELAKGEVIADNWGSIYPSNDNVKQMAYYAMMDISKMQNAIFTDNPKELGINILLGREPHNADEIAISKSFYDYMIYYKNFAIDIDNCNHQIQLTESNLLNNSQLVSIFGVKICGVFDDRNNIDHSLKEKDIDKMTAEELQKLQLVLDEEYSANPLINLVVKCKDARTEWGYFSGVNSDIKLTLENCFGTQNNDYYFNFAPLNSAVSRYYNLSSEIINTPLAKNEIFIDSLTLKKINTFLKKDNSSVDAIKEGSTLPMCVVGMSALTEESLKYPDKFYLTQYVTIAKVLDNIGTTTNSIFMNEETYNTFNIVKKYSQERLISSDHISASSLSKLNKDFNYYANSLFDTNCNNYINYSIQNCPIKKSSEFGFISVSQQYLCIPLMILSIFMSVGIIIVFYSDFVKTKAKDLLILKSLGAKKKDFLTIYSIFCVVLVAIQMLFGLLLGSLLIYLINIFTSKISGYANIFTVFYLDSVSWVFTIFAVLLINVVSLFISLSGISNKNLRKAFQKLKR